MHTPANISIFEAIKTGFVTNVLNPKASLWSIGGDTADVPLWVLLIISAHVDAVPLGGFVSYIYQSEGG